ncbi:WD repeat-containing protein 35 [Octopus bimaculoides]|nr:WD repeat-containing protein 35 [Octopus bimaculoides]
MIVYLSKKITMPNSTKLFCVAWNKKHGYIACGGESGFLKIMHLESPLHDAKQKHRHNVLPLNQNVSGHSGCVEMIRWNDTFHRLTTSDSNGLIIVWGILKDKWNEEMINNRQTGVQDMKWTGSGKMICIVFDDGMVIVGTVEGERIWGKDLGEKKLCKVEWSPDEKILLFGLMNGEVCVFDSMGNYISQLNILSHICTSTPLKLVTIDWFKGNYRDPTQACLMIAYHNGHVRIMKSETDEDPVIIETEMYIEDVSWNPQGSVIAVGGKYNSSESDQDPNFINFYSQSGDLLRNLKIPSKNLKSFSWDKAGLRLAIASDHLLYFANIKPDYKWGYCSSSIIYHYTKPERNEICVVFWETVKDIKYVKYMNSFVNIATHGDYCCIVTKSEEMEDQFVLVLCNSIGTPLEQKYVEMEPVFILMTKTHVIMASREAFYLWHFKNPKKATSLLVSSSKKSRRERLYHIDVEPSPSATQSDVIDFSVAFQGTNNPICCMCASENILLIARMSGVVHRYSLPHVLLEHKYNFNTIASLMEMNCNLTILALVDNYGVLSMYNLNGYKDNNGKSSNTEQLNFDRKDVWNIKWANDNPNLFALMEKERMLVVRGIEPEEPVSSKGYLCHFSDLQIKTVLLENIMTYPQNPTKDFVIDIEIKSLRDTREMLTKVSLEEALHFIEKNPHPRLWRLLAETALEAMDTGIAEQAFVHCQDYYGIQFVKKLNNQQIDAIKKAEVLCYFHKFDEAEQLYVSIDRWDLAVAMRKKMGDWFRVLHLLTSNSSGDDNQLEEAWNAIGDYFADRQQWLIKVDVSDLSPLLPNLLALCQNLKPISVSADMGIALWLRSMAPWNIGDMFITVGMCEQAVEAYIKCNRVKAAIDCCIQLNHWNMAIDLARKYSIKDIDSMLTKYMSHLLEKGRTMNAVELYCKAGHYLEAAKLLMKEAKKIAKVSKLLLMKKVYVLIGLLMEKYHEQMKFNVKARNEKGKKSNVSTPLEGILQEDTASMSDSHLIDNGWHHAEAYHFYILAQTQLQTGYVDSAMKTALVLRDYEDVLDPVDIYSLLALAAYANCAFGTCSKAFIKLESLETLDPAQRKQYEEMAFEVFSRHTPKDSKYNQVECPSCSSTMPDWTSVCPSCDIKYPPCIVSGRTIMDYHYWMCNSCKHRAYESEIVQRQTCPLCHSPF